jgi:anti-sigma-K factor RskA
MNSIDSLTPQELELRIAEYVLGVLDASERAEVADLVANHPHYAAHLNAWQQRLGPLTEEYDALEAPSFIWSRITHELALALPVTPAANPITPRRSFWSSLAVWRGLSAGALAASLVLGGVLIMQPKPANYSAPLTAALQLENGAALYTATVDAQRQRITIIPASSIELDGRVAELWFISPGAKPRSLGILPADLAMSVEIPADLQQQMSANTLLAISLEPAGGSPTQQPTGPVVAKGNIFTL